MGTLGEAYIAVKADLRPFTRDLRKEVSDAVDGVVDDTNKKLKASLGEGGGEAGDKFGKGFSDGMGRRLGDKGKPPWITITAALGAALDDGISALPAELKAAIVLGIAAAAVPAAAALTGLITAGVAAGTVGIGVALASQFEQVQTRAEMVFNAIRLRLIDAAEPFGLRVLQALDAIDDRVNQFIGPELDALLDKASDFVIPLTEGLLDGLETFFASLTTVMGDSDEFVDALSEGFVILAGAIGQALEILAATGEDGANGLRDLIFFTADLVVGIAKLFAILTKAYGAARDLASSLDPVAALFGGPAGWAVGLFGGFVRESDAATLSAKNFSETNHNLLGGFEPLISATDRQTKAMKEYAKAIEEARDNTIDGIEATINFEQALDDLEDSLKRNGDTLDFETDEGRDNLRRLQTAIEEAQEAAERRYQSGELNATQARALYDEEIAKLTTMAAKWNLTEAEIRSVFGAAMDLLAIPDPNTSWLTRLLNMASLVANQLERAVRAARSLRESGADTPWGGGHQEFADGGIVSQPTSALIGEAGREVVIPLTRPARAAQLVQQSGLGAMLGMGSSIIQVYIGNEAVDRHMIRIVESNNARLSQSLTFGAR